jgi:hypothetical protein
MTKNPIPTTDHGDSPSVDVVGKYGMRYVEILRETATETFYHGTSIEAAQHMQEHGFGTASRLGGMASGAPAEMKQFTFLTPSKSVAKWYALNRIGRRDGAVVEVHYPAKSFTASRPVNDYGALDEAGEAYGVPKIATTGYNGRTIQELDVGGIVKALRQHGMNALAYRDTDANYRASLLAFDHAAIRFVRAIRFINTPS